MRGSSWALPPRSHRIAQKNEGRNAEIVSCALPRIAYPPGRICDFKTLLNMEAKADIALIGLAVMGQNLILNMNDHGFTVVAYNRTTEKVDAFLANEAK